MSSDIDICNSGLAKLGVDMIVSLEDDTRQAKLCKEQYSKLKQAFLRSHPWNFATERAAIAASATLPAFGWDNKFRAPIDCLRVLQVNENDYPWVKEGDYIFTNDTECELLYISDVVEGKFDALSAEVLSYLIAIDLSENLNPGAKQLLLQESEMKLRGARAFDAQESYTGKVVTKTFINSRR
jgi:hypothetical protein